MQSDIAWYWGVAIYLSSGFVAIVLLGLVEYGARRRLGRRMDARRRAELRVQSQESNAARMTLDRLRLDESAHNLAEGFVAMYRGRFIERLPELRHRYSGEFVALSDDNQVLAHGMDLDRVTRLAREMRPKTPLFIDRVGSVAQETIRIAPTFSLQEAR